MKAFLMRSPTQNDLIQVLQAWPKAYTERELMTYLSRETQKLVELAWSDATLQMVVGQNPDTSISKLRAGVLQLSQPSDGA